MSEVRWPRHCPWLYLSRSVDLFLNGCAWYKNPRRQKQVNFVYLSNWCQLHQCNCQQLQFYPSHRWYLKLHWVYVNSWTLLRAPFTCIAWNGRWLEGTRANFPKHSHAYQWYVYISVTNVSSYSLCFCHSLHCFPLNLLHFANAWRFGLTKQFPCEARLGHCKANRTSLPDVSTALYSSHGKAFKAF